MTLFRAAAFILFVIGAILAVLYGSFKEPAFYICAGLACLALSGASFDRRVS